MDKVANALLMVMGIFYAVYFWMNLRRLVLHPFEMLAYGVVGMMLLILLLRGGDMALIRRAEQLRKKRAMVEHGRKFGEMVRVEKEGKMSKPESYGEYYWGIRVSTSLSKDGIIYAHADEVRLGDNGSLTLIRSDKGYPVLCIAAEFWFALFAASVIDGHAVGVEHWKM